MELETLQLSFVVIRCPLETVQILLYLLRSSPFVFSCFHSIMFVQSQEYADGLEVSVLKYELNGLPSQPH